MITTALVTAALLAPTFAYVGNPSAHISVQFDPANVADSVMMAGSAIGLLTVRALTPADGATDLTVIAAL
jgi:hypothetical protein